MLQSITKSTWQINRLTLEALSVRWELFQTSSGSHSIEETVNDEYNVEDTCLYPVK